jgi:hypothetical protein
MIEPNDLLSAGFRQYPASTNLDKGPLFQKCYEDPNGRSLYFINITEHIDLIERHPDLADNYRWSAECHLYFDDEGLKGSCVTYFIRSATTVAEIEEFYQRAFVALGCVPDPHND